MRQEVRFTICHAQGQEKGSFVNSDTIAPALQFQNLRGHSPWAFSVAYRGRFTICHGQGHRYDCHQYVGVSCLV